MPLDCSCCWLNKKPLFYSKIFSKLYEMVILLVVKQLNFHFATTISTIASIVTILPNMDQCCLFLLISNLQRLLIVLSEECLRTFFLKSIKKNKCRGTFRHILNVEEISCFSNENFQIMILGWFINRKVPFEKKNFLVQKKTKMGSKKL